MRCYSRTKSLPQAPNINDVSITAQVKPTKRDNEIADDNEEMKTPSGDVIINLSLAKFAIKKLRSK